MAKYRKKPVVIEAVQYNGLVSEIVDFAVEEHPDNVFKIFNYFDGELFINTLEGKVKANKGDYIIKGVNGEFYPCKPDIFEKTYEIVE
ncbi:hypothetical protein JOC86_002382 [Bacillus pakistanensis]|uniref:Phage protein n=1 Tax=Rossellomorea pakistanensis TaxID=992288 RepID=A0ABS2NDC3_9BACI|nr:hypothetical protein [Bacillus pakistanensis]